MDARIHSFQTMGAVDGPGLRFVVFLQGCNLRCQYCHNPDTWAKDGGMVYSAKEVFLRILRCRPYFGKTGGVTVSGGEPLLQSPFVCELFALCRQSGIHTCLDTSGQPLQDDVDRLLSVTDLCLLDIKAVDDAHYLSLCGTDLQTPLLFLRLLDKNNIATWIRHVIVPGLNDTMENIRALNALLKPFACIQKVELLPFHALCVEKYRQMDIPFPLEHTPPMENAQIQRLASYLTLPH